METPYEVIFSANVQYNLATKTWLLRPSRPYMQLSFRKQWIRMLRSISDHYLQYQLSYLKSVELRMTASPESPIVGCKRQIKTCEEQYLAQL